MLTGEDPSTDGGPVSHFGPIKILAGVFLFVALALAVLTAILSFADWRAFGAARKISRERREVWSATVGLRAAVEDAETGQRGYLLTGDPRYLEAYLNALREVNQNMDRLTAAVDPVPSERERVGILRELVVRKMAELNETTVLRRAGNAEAALAIVTTGRGKELMDRIRAACQEIFSNQNAALDLQDLTMRNRQTRAIAISGVGGAALFVFLCLAATYVRRAENQRDRFVNTLRRINQRLRAARDLWSTTLSCIGDGVVATDRQGRVTFMNPVASALTGWKNADAKGRDLQEIFSIVNADTRAPAGNPVARALRDGLIQGLANHALLLAKDGSESPIDECAAPILDAGGETVGAVLVFRDITAREEAQRRLRDSQAFCLGIVESSPDPILTLDSEACVVALDEAARSGHEIGVSLEGARWLELWEDPNGADRALTVARNGGVGRFQASSGKFDGIVKWWDVAVYRVPGKPVRFVSTARDISEFKVVEENLAAALAGERAARAEAERARVHLDRQAQELARSNADLERFAFAASHDLQEPLRTITSYTQLFLRRFGQTLDADGQSFLTFVTEAAARMSALIRDLLAYSQVLRLQPSETEPVDCATVLDLVLRNCDLLVRESGARVLRDALPVVPGLEFQLVRIFQNLVTNSIKYRRPGVPPEIAITARDEGREWVFCVRDNGVGIAPQYQNQVFVMFRRLHNRHQSGSGLGLALCQRIIQGNGGRIWLESEVGVGSRFCFTWPKKISTTHL